MSIGFTGPALNVLDSTAGRLVQRATALPPATGASHDLFSIDGGRVMLFGLVGLITVAVPNEVLSFDLDLDPDDGGADKVLATALSVQNLAAGVQLRLNTTTGGAFVSHVTTVAASVLLAVPLLLEAGDIRLDVTGGGAIGTTARVAWDIVYAPWDPAAVVTAV